MLFTGKSQNICLNKNVFKIVKRNFKRFIVLKVFTWNIEAYNELLVIINLLIIQLLVFDTLLLQLYVKIIDGRFNYIIIKMNK